MEKKYLIFFGIGIALIISIIIILYFVFRKEKGCKTQSDCGDNEICDDSGKCIKPRGCQKQSDCGDDEFCDNSGKCIKPKPKNGVCTDNKECNSKEFCENKKCKPKQYYCIVNPDTHLNECKISAEKPEQYSLGPFLREDDCDNMCDNKCGDGPSVCFRAEVGECNKGAVCASGNCVSCSENKVDLNNASSCSLWYYSYDNNMKYIPLIYDKNSNFFGTLDQDGRGNQYFNIYKKTNGTFNIESSPDSPYWWYAKNFKLKNNNMYESTEIEYDSPQGNHHTSMQIIPQTCVP